MIQFGPWQPDQYALGKNVAGEALGVLPGAGGYVPWPMPVQASAALASAAVGAAAGRTIAGVLQTFAFTQTKAKKFADVSTWTDVTPLAGNFNIPDDETMSTTQYGDQLLATDANDGLHTIDIAAGSNFAAVSGSPPAARVVATVGDFVMLAGLTDNPNRVHWSGRNAYNFWTPGTRDCDIQDFPDGGATNGIAPFGQGRGLIFQESAIRAFVATNDRSIFNFQRVENERGLVASQSLVTSGGIAFYRSQSGFYATDGAGQSRPIGADVCDRWFQGEANLDRLFAVRAAVDPTRQRIMWLFPTSGNSSAVLDHCICYDVPTNSWTHAEVSASFIFTAGVPGYTIDTIDTLLAAQGHTLETVPYSFDSRFLLGGQPVQAIFDDEFKLAFFTGGAMAATIETADFQPIPGQRTFVRGCRPLTDATTATIAMGSKERPQGSLTFGAASAQNASGMCPLRSSGRWLRARMAIPASAEWSHAAGVSCDEDNPRTALIAAAGNR